MPRCTFSKRLAQLPKGMKYMSALRYLYTHGCDSLKMMPPGIGCLTSLRTLTWFVAGTPGSRCSNVGELRLLDLGGLLEVHHLENVRGSDTQAANLENKKRLTELTLRWSDTNRELPQHDHNKVLGGLKPHDGIKVLKVYFYGGRNCPAWMNTLHHMVELVLYECNKIEKFPPLWQLPSLQLLHVSGMENVQCFCCGGDPPFTFKKLKVLKCYSMPNLEIWCNINEVQGHQPMFPELEKLSICSCKKLTALPRAPAIKQSSSMVVNTTVWRSACPALKELRLEYLTAFQRWEAGEGTLDEHITTFPSLEKLIIFNCPELTILPKAPKLNELNISGEGSQRIGLHAVARYNTSLSTLMLSIHDDDDDSKEDDSIHVLEKWIRGSYALKLLSLQGEWGFLFLQPSAPTEMCNRFVRLVIWKCDALEHLSENVFKCFVSLRILMILECKRLTGWTQQDASEKPTLPESSSCVLLPPSLEYLNLWECDSLVEIPTPLPASLRELRIGQCASLVEVPSLPASLSMLDICTCDKLESVVFHRQQKDTRLGKSAAILGSSTATPNLSPSPTGLRIDLSWCSNIQSVSVQLDCTESLEITGCKELKSIDGDFPWSLERLILLRCDNLESIPDGPPQASDSSLRVLVIQGCPRLKVLPPSLKQRLNDIEQTVLDDCYKETRPSRLWKRLMGRHY